MCVLVFSSMYVRGIYLVMRVGVTLIEIVSLNVCVSIVFPVFLCVLV